VVNVPALALTTVYVIRSVAVAVFLRDVLRRASIHVVPFHPDRCGGRRPVAAIGLNNQYLLSIYGINVISLTLVSRPRVEPEELKTLILLAATLDGVIGPIMFVAPLMPFRVGMKRAKAELLNAAGNHAAAVVEPGKEPFDVQRRFARRNGRPSCVFARPRRFAAIISMPYCVVSRSSSRSLS
jgi:hypothetical protein